MPTPLTAPFTLELSAPALAVDLDQVAAGQGALTAKLVGLVAGDVVQQASFAAASRSGSGARVEKLIDTNARAAGQIKAVPLNALQSLLAFTFDAADIDAFRSASDYAYTVRAWVLRGSDTIARDVLAGRLTAATSYAQTTAVVLGDVVEVDVTPASATLFSQQSYAFSAATKATGGTVLTGRTIAWQSSNPAVASVDGSGLVTPVAPGTATITATCDGVSGSAAITVTALTIGGGFTIGG